MSIFLNLLSIVGVPLYSAESPLRHSDWSRDSVLEKWREQPLMDTTNSTTPRSEMQQPVVASAAGNTKLKLKVKYEIQIKFYKINTKTIKKTYVI